ncbi:MAG: hypothetical protein AB7O66_16145 [Limisphaerales bacterium]
MEPAQAKSILARWRPDGTLDSDPEIQEALRLLRSGGNHDEWLRRHAQFQTATSAALRQIPIPPDLAAEILARVSPRVLRPAFPWTRSLRLAAAGFIAALLIASMFLRDNVAADYTTFRGRMVRAALREYRMEITTNDVPAIRAYLTRQKAPADFNLPPGLAALPAIGAGTLSWKDGRAAMVCLNGGQDGMFYVFVVPTSELTGAPPARTEFARVNRLSTGAWTDRGRTYVVASSSSLDAIRKYF